MLAQNGILFAENKGQWHKNVLYKADIPGGVVYLENNTFTYTFYEDSLSDKVHSFMHEGAKSPFIRTHSIKSRFLNALTEVETKPSGKSSSYNNYFIGNDSSKWASHVGLFTQVEYTELYPGINMQVYAKDNSIKYDLLVSPSAKTEDIMFEISGAKRLKLKDGNLHVTTSVNEYMEYKPYAYQWINNQEVEVPCFYKLNKNKVSFSFPEGYDNSKALVIDPEISFSSFIGSNSSNFGFTASYDDQGNLYSGAIVFGSDYPVTPGAFQQFYGFGIIDCAITKWNANGTDLIYSSYLGGLNNEAPHSIVVNNNNELYIYGSTGSSNFPVSANGFQTTFAGGPNVSGLGQWQYNSGIDIFITKISSGGSSIIGSTYMGGSGTDGIGTGTVLDNNYGDVYRGEIIVDETSNVYVASNTTSSDFPMENSFQGSYGGGNIDGCVFKLNSGLTDLIWGSYIGGSGDDASYSLQLNSTGEIYVAGGSNSANFPNVSNGFANSLMGEVDGYILRVSISGNNVISGTLNGSAFFDQNYFVQIDTQDDVYVVGQTAGAYPVSNGVYANTNSGQFIHKFNANLNNSIWSTVVGSGETGIDLSPSAFLVSNCGEIFLSGWGGGINFPLGSTTNGFPVTADAFQSSTDGNDFYLMVLGPDAESLEYATFFGGDGSPEHVDGGTSRFDKNGTVYHSVCAGCGGTNDYPTTEGVWSQTNNSDNCNLGVFKFKLSSVNAIAELEAPPLLCAGDQFSLLNFSVGANVYEWDLGDGNNSTLEEPVHSYNSPGEYQVQLLAIDTSGCLSPDSTNITIIVEDVPEVSVLEVDPLCPGENITLEASGASTYEWIPSDGLSNNLIASPQFIGTETTEYLVVGSTLCGSDTAFIEVVVGNLNVNVTESDSICLGESIQLIASGGTDYLWSPPLGLSNVNIANPVASPEVSTPYSVQITTADGCEVNLDVEITVFPGPPELTGDDTYVVCNGNPAQINIYGAEDYFWQPGTGLSNSSISNPMATPEGTTNYIVTGTNFCGSDQLEVQVKVNEVTAHAWSDSLVCYDQDFFLHGSGGYSYHWTPENLVADPNSPETTAKIKTHSIFTLTVKDEDDCWDQESIMVFSRPKLYFWAGPDYFINYGDDVELHGESPLPLTWDFSPFLSCLMCDHPNANPLETTTFYANIINNHGCTAKDSLVVNVLGDMYIPNAFTPDGDGINDVFKARGIDINTFNMKIYNRWGELVFESNSIDQGWNGEDKNSGYYAEPAVYNWKIVAIDKTLQRHFDLKGSVILIR